MSTQGRVYERIKAWDMLERQDFDALLGEGRTIHFKNDTSEK